MKTYVITLSQVFPVTHKRAGERTGFKEKFFNGLDKERDDGKLHTIRANYGLWRKRFNEIEEGKACLSVRQWSGKPYRSKQVELTRLTREDSIGIQEVMLKNGDAYFPFEGRHYTISSIAKNDGLSFADWLEWFKSYDLSKPLAVIHFTHFRY